MGTLEMPHVEGQLHYVAIRHFHGRLAEMLVHHWHDTVATEAPKRPSVFDQNVRVRRGATFASLGHERHVRDKDRTLFDLLVNRIHDRGRARHAKGIFVKRHFLVVPRGWNHVGLSSDLAKRLLQGILDEATVDPVRSVALPGIENGARHHGNPQLMSRRLTSLSTIVILPTLAVVT